MHPEVNIADDEIRSADKHPKARVARNRQPFYRSRRAFACGALVALFAGIAVPAFGSDAGQRKVYTLSLVNGLLSGSGNTLKLRQGEDVELRWSSDKPMELHLHGYDIEVKVGPSAPAVMSFKANIPGRFPVEPHGQGPGNHRAVLYLEVYP